MSKKGIVLTSYNRPNSLKECLKNIYKSNLSADYTLIIVQQDITAEIQNIINQFNSERIVIINTSYPKDWSAYKKMTINGFKGFEHCFETLKCDVGFYLEDDIIVSYDFFVFCEVILNKYKKDRNFFAVNGFSKEPFDDNKKLLYSKFIFGIGKGWAINSDKWKIIKDLWNDKFINSKNPEYDYPIENYIKQNFFYVVMPICSRTYEIMGDGVSIKKENTKYFLDFKKSFTQIINKDYKFKFSFFSKYTWRKDCKKYKGKLLSYPMKMLFDFKKFLKKL